MWACQCVFLILARSADPIDEMEKKGECHFPPLDDKGTTPLYLEASSASPRNEERKKGEWLSNQGALILEGAETKLYKKICRALQFQTLSVAIRSLCAREGERLKKVVELMSSRTEVIYLAIAQAPPRFEKPNSWRLRERKEKK